MTYKLEGNGPYDAQLGAAIVERQKALDELAEAQERFRHITEEMLSFQAATKDWSDRCTAERERAERAEAACVEYARLYAIRAQREDGLQQQIATLTQERKRLAHAIDPTSETDRLLRSVESLEQLLVDERSAVKTAELDWRNRD